MNGTAVTPAADHLFKVNEKNPELLNAQQADIFHHIVMQLFYLCNRVRIDIHTAVAFLTTRVTKPDKDDWSKLTRVIRYLRANKDLSLTLEANPSCSGGLMRHSLSILTCVVTPGPCCLSERAGYTAFPLAKRSTLRARRRLNWLE